jgi:hypothetical protein
LKLWARLARAPGRLAKIKRRNLLIADS